MSCWPNLTADTSPRSKWILLQKWFLHLLTKEKSVALSLKLVKASRPTNHQTVRPSETSEECLAVLPVAFDKKRKCFFCLWVSAQKIAKNWGPFLFILPYYAFQQNMNITHQINPTKWTSKYLHMINQKVPNWDDKHEQQANWFTKSQTKKPK